MKKLLGGLLITLLFMVSCSNIPSPGSIFSDPATASIFLAAGIRGIPDIKIQSGVKVTCFAVGAIEALKEGEILDINKVFEGDWNAEESLLVNDIKDLFIARLKNEEMPLSGKTKEYFDYVSDLISLTCSRLKLSESAINKYRESE